MQRQVGRVELHRKQLVPRLGLDAQGALERAHAAWTELLAGAALELADADVPQKSYERWEPANVPGSRDRTSS